MFWDRRQTACPPESASGVLSPAVSSHEARQPVYLGPRFLDVSACFATDSQLMPGGGVELAPELWKAEKINEATVGEKKTRLYTIMTHKRQKNMQLYLNYSSISGCGRPLPLILASKLWLPDMEN